MLTVKKADVNTELSGGCTGSKKKASSVVMRQE